MGKSRGALIAALVCLLLAPVARAELQCVYLPMRFPVYDPPIDALRIYGDGVRTREIRPIWYASGGTTLTAHHCGESTALITVRAVRDAATPQESADSPVLLVDGTETTLPLPLSLYDTLIERAAKAIEFFCPPPGTCEFDFVPDGYSTPEDKSVLLKVIRRELP